MSNFQHSGCPKEVVTPEIINKIHGMIFDDRTINVCAMATVAGITTNIYITVLSHQDNIRTHTCVVPMTKINKKAYWRDLTPSDFPVSKSEEMAGRSEIYF